MENLNIYKKIQIILLILIIISIAVFMVSLKNRKQANISLVEEVSVKMQDIKKEDEEKLGEVNENLNDTSWDEENVENTEVDMNNKEESEKNNSSTYYIKINYTANCITVYTKDSSGEYTNPVKAIICSTGTATPRSGVYKMGEKYRWHQLNGGVFGQYCTRITGHILFHSVPYASKSNNSLKYVAYDKLGTKASAGCIRLTVEDAIWIYTNCPTGTLVEFYSSSDPGPLGKPSSQKISSVVECRNWDPTDPADGNPWHTYNGEIITNEETKKEEPVKQVENKQSKTNLEETKKIEKEEKSQVIESEKTNENNYIKENVIQNEKAENEKKENEEKENEKIENEKNENEKKENKTTSDTKAQNKVIDEVKNESLIENTVLDKENNESKNNKTIE